MVPGNQMITRLQNWLYRLFGIDKKDIAAMEQERKRKMLILVISLITTTVLGTLAAVQED